MYRQFAGVWVRLAVPHTWFCVHHTVHDVSCIGRFPEASMLGTAIFVAIALFADNAALAANPTSDAQALSREE